MKKKRKPLTFEEKKAKVAQFNVMDDTFFHKMAEDIEVIEEILQIILENPGLKLLECHYQLSLKNLQGKSSVLDALGKDEHGRRVVIEVQKKDDDNHVRRTRYVEALATSAYTEKGNDYIKVPNVIVVFLSRFDLFGMGKTVYHVRPSIQETGDIVNDGTLYIYVNSKVNDGSLIAELMQYMKHSEGENMHFSKLSNRVKIFKESKEGVEAMCEIMERERMEGILEGRAEGTANRDIELIQKKIDKRKGIKQIADEMEETVENMKNLIIFYKDQLNFPESWEKYYFEL